MAKWNLLAVDNSDLAGRNGVRFRASLITIGEKFTLINDRPWIWPESRVTVDQDTLRKYDGMLFTEVTPACRKEIECIARSFGLLTNFDVAGGYVGFQFSGRDTNRVVVKMLSEIARVIGDAEGEISCATTTDAEQDPILTSAPQSRNQETGEQTAQACEKAWFRQLTAVRLHVIAFRRASISVTGMSPGGIRDTALG
jgi:hypothetical protein